ncbi:MAG: efflux RND transporter periplasmic adaptor subunit [Proteobacteria bacterium]|nr:efflux RND transporter periplasmic adaptor subunit [Pseudomonadota bacterium]
MKVRQLVTIINIATIILFLGCDKDGGSDGKKVRQLATANVTASKVVKRIAGNQIEVVGTVQAVEQAVISAKITGNVITLPVDLGSRVKHGELLAELSAAEISAQVQEARAQLEQAKRNLAREENLLKKNAATPETVKALNDSLRIAEAAHKTTLTMLDFTRITAPFTGIITRKLVSVGDLATPGKPLLHIEEENNLQVLTDIPEAMILKITKGDKLKVFIPSVDLGLVGTVSEVSPVADPSSRTSPIKLRIPNNPQLRSGQFARVTLAMAQAETLAVPAGAVVPFGQMEKVFVVDDGKAWLRLVRTGAKSDQYLEILSGLAEGENVVVDGNNNLEDGQPVTVQ